MTAARSRWPALVCAAAALLLFGRMLVRVDPDVFFHLKEGGRVRPLVAHPQAPNCLEPRDMAGRRHVDLDQFHLKDTGSYPSTHALMGLAVALVLSEVLPERADALMARGLEFGESRLICGFHYHSDLEGGRLVAATLYARLQANPAYRQDIVTLRQELAVAP